MPKGSPELTNARREEIISACETLYQTMGFKEVTIKEIARYTSFSRPSIYNYFETKEEIFLAILQREYWRWTKELDQVTESCDSMTRDQVAEALARTISAQPQMLKILSMNHFDMEANSRMENLVEFKKSYGATLEAVDRLLKKFCPDMTDRDRQDFLYRFFPFIYGIHPYTAVTDKQRESDSTLLLRKFRSLHDGDSARFGIGEASFLTKHDALLFPVEFRGSKEVHIKGISHMGINKLAIFAMVFHTRTNTAPHRLVGSRIVAIMTRTSRREIDVAAVLGVL